MLKRNNIYYYDNNSIIMKYINTFQTFVYYYNAIYYIL